MTADGLQVARTALSWRRTVASAIACGALLVHHAVADSHGWTAAAFLLAAGAGPLGVSAAALVRHRRDMASLRLVVLVSAAVTISIVLAFFALLSA